MNEHLPTEVVLVFCPRCGNKFRHRLTSSGKKMGGWSGAGAGAWIGSGIGIAAGPVGAIAGTIPGAIIGGIVGLKAGSSLNDDPECTRCATKFSVPKNAIYEISVDDDRRQKILKAIGLALQNCDREIFEEIKNISDKSGFSLPPFDGRYSALMLGIAGKQYLHFFKSTDVWNGWTEEEREIIFNGKSFHFSSHTIGMVVNDPNLVGWIEMGASAYRETVEQKITNDWVKVACCYVAYDADGYDSCPITKNDLTRDDEDFRQLFLDFFMEDRSEGSVTTVDLNVFDTRQHASLTYDDWLYRYRVAAAQANKHLHVNSDGISIIDFMDDTPLKAAYNDGINPSDLGRAFGLQFDPSDWGMDQR